MKPLRTAAVLLTFLSACNNKSSDGKGSWAQLEKDAFMTNCSAQAQKTGTMDATKAKDYCSCMLDKVEEKYPNAADAANLTAIDASNMAKECLK